MQGVKIRTLRIQYFGVLSVLSVMFLKVQNKPDLQCPKTPPAPSLTKCPCKARAANDLIEELGDKEWVAKKLKNGKGRMSTIRELRGVAVGLSSLLARLHQLTEELEDIED
jgi:hypothetical protein